MTDMTQPTRRFGPKTADHPNVGKPCPACEMPLAAGDFTALVILGPGADPDSRRKAVEGIAYNAIAIEIHWACATGEEQL